MPSYKVPVEDYTFIMNDVLKVQERNDIPGYSDLVPDFAEAVLTELAKVCEDVIAPLNHSGDQEGCTRHEDGSVTTPKGYKEAYDTYMENGWGGLSSDPQYGGQGMPQILSTIKSEILCSANLAFEMYLGLTQGAMASISMAGSEEQKQKYLPNMVSGKWTGTMNLTEAHCGTDLGMMRSKAIPQEDGTYKISGQKIFISAGEHDLAENIIHLVLAKVPGGPEGTKGISLFIVPKFLVNEDGSLGERNGVSCGAIEEKMGIHGNSTCVLNYDEATGYLVGEEHDGLRPMFIMMNAARLGVGLQGISLAEVAYQNAAEYARDRLQMRSISGVKAPEKPADPIIVHPDVRRNLMDIRSFVQGARGVAMWTATKLEESLKHEDESMRQLADDIVGLMTPVIKGVFTDLGFDSTVQAQQVFGGHGYIAEWGMEQFVRDARIAQIYEGTNGIQALDLVGRKLGRNNGRAIQAYFKLLEDFCKEHDNDDMQEFVEPLKKSITHLQRASLWLMQNGLANPDNAGAASVSYMHLMGLVAMGHSWVMQIAAAKEMLAAGHNNPKFLENKIITARYYMQRMLPDTRAHLSKIEVGADVMMALAADDF